MAAKLEQLAVPHRQPPPDNGPNSLDHPNQQVQTTPNPPNLEERVLFLYGDRDQFTSVEVSKSIGRCGIRQFLQSVPVMDRHVLTD